MLIIEFAVVLMSIYLGARLGGIGIGFAGGMGVLALTLVLGLEPGTVPVDVILIIMSVIAAIASMQVAGGLHYLVEIAERILRRNPKQITFWAPVVTYVMTLLAGTGHTAFSTLPVIAEVSKDAGVRPSRPLSIAVIASQIAITASPISAAVVLLSGMLETSHSVDYLQLLAIAIPSTFLACMVGAFVAQRLGLELADDPIYQQRLKDGLVTTDSADKKELPVHAKRSVWIFLASIVAVVAYATAISPLVGLIEDPSLPRNEAIMVFMLSAATLIVMNCKINTAEIVNAATFKSGMSACVCVLGVAWLGDTFVSAHIDEIKELAGTILQQYSWMLAIILFFASMLLYSQAATTAALMPTAIALGVSPEAAIASFAAVSALFVLPTYPTLIAAVEMDDTGSTRIGQYVFNHPFMIPGLVTITASVCLGFLFAGVIL
ncbi:anaerobic C4-dicarboxylate transporter [Alginatibacterium sediminis]|uniref:C4-dicarboxylate transporter n=1 Tax=Alginatibacterium sediminis TaxID=2164068 RepID=A0A420E6R4_9ALTE|nr:anaerobic C4-dicarboxylate transporter [Alginatibacterium sediminis]RKF13750.1 anaerobic C4-dicarboxylate transporter [Alginatibacterium sediminis]